MYYDDLSEYKYLRTHSHNDDISIGWLDSKHPYSQGTIKDFSLERLWEFCCYSVLKTLGYHECELCEDPEFGVVVKNNSKKITLGSAEIRVLGLDNIVYAAPDLIYHYVTYHNYSPPQEFIKALIDSPLPNTSEYKVQAKKYSWYEEF